MALEVPAGYWEFDLQSRELLLCPRSRRMFGFTDSSPRKLASHDWHPRVHPDDMPVVMGELETAQRQDDIYAARFRALRPDGSICQILGVGRLATVDPKHFVGLNFDLGSTAATALRAFRAARGSTIALASGILIRGGFANENDSRPWRAKPPARASRKGDAGIAEREWLTRRAQAMLELRQLRTRFLNPAMLGEPAFDLLLNLYVSSTSKMMSTATLSEFAGLSLSVTVRWLRFLVKEGLVLTVESEADDTAGTSVAMTDKARIALDEYFRASGRNF